VDEWLRDEGGRVWKRVGRMKGEGGGFGRGNGAGIGKGE
jgi:hypothetical protein